MVEKKHQVNFKYFFSNKCKNTFGYPIDTSMSIGGGGEGGLYIFLVLTKPF